MIKGESKRSKDPLSDSNWQHMKFFFQWVPECPVPQFKKKMLCLAQTNCSLLPLHISQAALIGVTMNDLLFKIKICLLDSQKNNVNNTIIFSQKQ